MICIKVVQINNVYLLGSTGKIVKDIHYALIENNFKSIVCYSNGKKINEKNIYKVSNLLLQKIDALTSRITGIMYGGCIVQTQRIIKILKKEKPDTVHIQCINGYTVNIYRLIKWLNDNNIKTVLTLHAEFMYTANCGYALECNKWITGCGNCPRLRKETKSVFIDNTHKSWTKMYNAFKGFKNIKVISVSPWLMDRAKTSPILKEFEHSVVFNGLDTDIFKVYDTKELKKKLNLENKKIIFHATPFFNDDKNHIKGGYYIIELAKRLKNDNVQVLVAGSYDKNIKVPDNITLLDKIRDQVELAKYYSMADVFLLTSKKETFSMTTAESLCCGTPVVGFKAGAPEQIAIKEYSSFVEYGNIEQLYKQVIIYLNKKKDSKLQKIAKEKYSKENMVKSYIKIYESLK